MRLPRLIPLRSSRRLRAFLLLLHLAALAVSMTLPVPWLVRALLALALGISLWRSWPESLPALLILREDGFLEWRDAPAEEGVVQTIDPSTVVMRLGVVLYDHPLTELGLDKCTLRRTLLLPDNLPPGEFRVLRMWLRGRALSVRYKTLKKLRGGSEISDDGSEPA
jgi:hypothetical protein